MAMAISIRFDTERAHARAVAVGLDSHKKWARAADVSLPTLLKFLNNEDLKIKTVEQIVRPLGGVATDFQIGFASAERRPPVEVAV